MKFRVIQSVKNNYKLFKKCFITCISLLIECNSALRRAIRNAPVVVITIVSNV